MHIVYMANIDPNLPIFTTLFDIFGKHISEHMAEFLY